MWNLEELQRHREIIDQIDWDMTPEKAVETYLEWGTGWARKDDFVRYPGQASYYFLVYGWERPLCVTLVRRDVSQMVEIARVEAPEELILEAVAEGGRKPGVEVYAVSEPLKEWLKRSLNC
ncbi:MAG TPA: hypothetical protein PLM79_03185 [Syntrophobacteraceae bacterium]|nr:hypothetical protein [Syntrophobacteraceae bacterium]